MKARKDIMFASMWIAICKGLHNTHMLSFFEIQIFKAICKGLHNTHLLIF